MIVRHFRVHKCLSNFCLQSSNSQAIVKQNFPFVSSARYKGHSHWQNVKSSKEAGDRMKCMTISRFCNRAKVLVREGGPDPNINVQLDRLIVDAINCNVPKDTMMKAIAAAVNKPILSLLYDYKGPGQSYFIIEALADTKAKVQYLLNGRLRKVPGGFDSNDKTVRSYFEHVGIVHVLQESRPAGQPVETVAKKSWNSTPPIDYPAPLTFEDAETLAIEMNAQHVNEITDEDDRPAFEIVCEADHVTRINNDLTLKHYAVVKATAEFRPLSRVTLSAQHRLYVDQFYTALEDMEEIQAIYDNVLYENEQSAD